jgi:hypothetical protein
MHPQFRHISSSSGAQLVVERFRAAGFRLVDFARDVAPAFEPAAFDALLVDAFVADALEVDAFALVVVAAVVPAVPLAALATPDAFEVARFAAAEPERFRFRPSPIGSASPAARTTPSAAPATVPAILPTPFPTFLMNFPGSGIWALPQVAPMSSRRERAASPRPGMRKPRAIACPSAGRGGEVGVAGVGIGPVR